MIKKLTSRSLSLIMLLSSLCSMTQLQAATNNPFDTHPVRYAVVNELAIAYQDMGPKAGEPVLLIMGLGAQMLHWGNETTQGLINKGYRVIAFDNRDAGLSQKLYQADVPRVWWAMLQSKMGWQVEATYTLTDMAADAIGVLDTLEITQAHIVGASMGGMIAQRVAAHYPLRTLSLTSIMSTPGAADLPPPTDAAMQVLLASPPVITTRAHQIERGINVRKILGSPEYFTVAAAKELVVRVMNRGSYSSGASRQLIAIAADGDRSELLKTIKAPTLVIHGAADPLVPVEHGRRTAELIVHAQYLEIPMMGHGLEPQIQRQIVSQLDQFYQMSSH